MCAVARQCGGAALLQCLPKRFIGIFARVDAAAAMTIGAREGAVMIGVAQKAEDMAFRKSADDGGASVRRTHRMQEGTVGRGAFGAAMHRYDFDHRRDGRVECLPVQAAHPNPITNMVGKRDCAAGIKQLQALPKLFRCVGQYQFTLVEVAVDDGAVAMGAGMNLIAGEHREASRLVRGRERVEMCWPCARQLRKASDVKIDNMGDRWIVDRHVGPVGMAGYGNEIELLFGPVQDRKSTRLNSSHVKISY